MDELIKYLKTFYDGLKSPVEVINSNGKVVYINEAFSIIWGYQLEELSEYSAFNDAVLKELKSADILQSIFNGRDQATIEYYEDSLLRMREYATPIIRASLFKLNFNNELYAVVFYEDLTELMLTEEEVKKSRDVSREAERLKNNFLNVLSHELRTPLNIILGYSSLIKENLSEKISAEDKIYLDNLHSGSERLFNSINQMLEFAQIEAGNFSLNIETVELVGLIKSILPKFQEEASEKNLEFRTSFSSKKIFVDADVHCTTSAINNLISNAVKFTHQGFVEVEADVLTEKNLALIRVKDSGVGISSKYLEHLYQPFSQEDLNIGRTYEGNGLGLALAKRYIEKLSGSLLVDSIKGVGSTFTFSLPLSKIIELKQEESETQKSPTSNKILMLDNAGDTFELIAAFLKRDYQVVNYSIREFKLDYVRDNSYSHIIFDVDKNFWQQGIFICKDIKKHDPFNRPIIIISSEFLDDKIREFYNAGARKYLVKPFGKVDLLKAIKDTAH